MNAAFSSDRKSVQELDRLKQAAKRARAPFDADYYTNAAFF